MVSSFPCSLNLQNFLSTEASSLLQNLIDPRETHYYLGRKVRLFFHAFSIVERQKRRKNMGKGYLRNGRKLSRAVIIFFRSRLEIIQRYLLFGSSVRNPVVSDYTRAETEITSVHRM